MLGLSFVSNAVMSLMLSLSNTGNASRIPNSVYLNCADAKSPHKSQCIQMKVILNGQPQRFDTPINVVQLLEYMALQGKRIAVERNGEIVPRSQFGEQMLADGDRLEIVVAVGGG